jgi:hypothetical protein
VVLSPPFSTTPSDLRKPGRLSILLLHYLMRLSNIIQTANEANLTSDSGERWNRTQGVLMYSVRLDDTEFD